VSSSGKSANAGVGVLIDAYTQSLAMSSDGRVAAFESPATNLVPVERTATTPSICAGCFTAERGLTEPRPTGFESVTFGFVEHPLAETGACFAGTLWALGDTRWSLRLLY